MAQNGHLISITLKVQLNCCASRTELILVFNFTRKLLVLVKNSFFYFQTAVIVLIAPYQVIRSVGRNCYFLNHLVLRAVFKHVFG